LRVMRNRDRTLQKMVDRGEAATEEEAAQKLGSYARAVALQKNG